MAILVIAEHDNKNLKAVTLNTIAAAVKLGEVHLLVAGYNSAPSVEAAKGVAGVEKVLWADAPHYEHGLAENLSVLVVDLAKSYSHVLAPASSFGRNLLPRIAALLDVAQISDVVSIESIDTFVCPIYAGNVLATVQSIDPIKVISVRATAFGSPGQGGGAVVETVTPSADTKLSSFISQALTNSDRPELGAAGIVVAGGRALGSEEQFNAVIGQLADQLSAAVGASRAAVDAGYAPNDYQVGQTGKVIAPRLYFAVGISGAIQHLAGMKDSKVIVAINQDSEAPIFQVADYGIVGDLFIVVPELMAELSK